MKDRHRSMPRAVSKIIILSDRSTDLKMTGRTLIEEVRALLGEADVNWTGSSVYLSKKETLGIIQTQKAQIFNTLHTLQPDAPVRDDQTGLLEFITTESGSVYHTACGKIHGGKVGAIQEAATELSEPLATKWLQILCNGDVEGNASKISELPWMPFERASRSLQLPLRSINP
ncbi:hypothetical protein BDD12DRAFT_802234 [Trichophaea hybrida]|nr:hypothetical protein BDD12DRAFT_802234 [Trichophaea hybrida]